MTNAPQPPLRARSRGQAGIAPDAFGRIDKSAARHTPRRPDFTEIQDSAEFIDLRRRVKRFVFPMTALFLAWYTTYVLVAAYARDFMAQPLFGEINVGLVFGILQFVSTLLITTLYVRFAAREIDPRVDEIRDNVEGPVQ